MERYKLRVTRTFEKDFRALDIQTKKRIDSAIKMLETDPCGSKPLRGNLAGKWSLRVGDYRIIYETNEDEKIIILYDTEHRKKVYK
ncbi:MAG: type II toxin-antitoxin system RelE/ParE family toxin [Candidatus Bathyarchaeia archaeon]